YVHNNDAACAKIERNPNDGTIFRVTDAPQNVGHGYETAGYDMILHYRRDTPIGYITARWDASYVNYWGEVGHPAGCTPPPDGSPAFGNYVGVNAGLGSLYGATWRWRSVATLTWDHGPWSASISGRYFSPIDEDCSQVIRIANRVHNPALRNLCSNPDDLLYIGGDQVPYNRAASVTFPDIEVSWSAPWHATFTVGARNALDRSPPVSYTTFANSFFPDYDAPGRFWYVRYRQRF